MVPAARRREAVVDHALWGLVGAMLFVVLVVGYRIAGGAGVGVPATLAIAVGVGLVTAGLAALVTARLG